MTCYVCDYWFPRRLEIIRGPADVSDVKAVNPECFWCKLWWEYRVQRIVDEGDAYRTIYMLASIDLKTAKNLHRALGRMIQERQRRAA